MTQRIAVLISPKLIEATQGRGAWLDYPHPSDASRSAAGFSECARYFAISTRPPACAHPRTASSASGKVRRGDLWPENESDEEVVTAIREWRRQGE